MSVQGFNDILTGSFAEYLGLSTKIGDLISQHAKLVDEAFKEQKKYIEMAACSKEPDQNLKVTYLQPLSKKINEIQDFSNKNRSSPYFNHLAAISESIPALGWVTITPTPAPYVKEMNDAAQFYTNRVLKDWKEKDKTHVNWVKSWIETLTELQKYIKQYHTTGLVWSSKGVSLKASPGLPPPPPPMIALDDLPDSENGYSANDDRAALFAQINRGEDITKCLKKVNKTTAPTLRTGPAPFKASVTGQQANATVFAPVFKRDGKKWLIEHQKSNQLTVDNAEMNNIVYIYKCQDTTVIVKGKINSIILDSCKKTSIVFDSVIASAEFINCQSIQMQVLGKVPTITIDKTDGCQMYLSKESLDVVIVSSKSSEMNVMVPKGSAGDYAETPVPEQFRTTVKPNGQLITEVVENKG